MTSNALTRKVLSLAEKYGIDPDFSLRCINAAERLAGTVKPEDVIIWSAVHGGLAWEALGPRKALRTGAGGTVYCVLPDGFPENSELWTRIDSAAVESGSGIRRICLSAVPELSSSSETTAYPSLIQQLLDRFFPRKPQSTQKSALEELFAERPAASAESGAAGKPEGAISDSPNVHIDSVGDIQERFLAAKAVLAAGLNPSLRLAVGESYEGALLSSQYLSANRNAIIRVSEDWDAVNAFQILGTMPILTPASEEDLTGALDWAAQSKGPVLIIEPGRKSLPSRTVFRKPWSSGRQIVAKEKSIGKAGKILFIVPGTLAREASKAAERLAKENFSVTVLSVRFLRPLDSGEITNFARDYDLVVVADPVNSLGGLKTSLGLELITSPAIPAIVPDSSMDGKTLAELAASAHRENRFLRTVDDVKKDRWR